MDDANHKHAKVWHLVPHDASAIDRMSRSLKLSPIVAQLLLNRQQAELPQAERFLASPLTGLLEPELLPGVPTAVERILAAIAQNKKICIYGDYDVDGVTATAILLRCLHLLQARVDFHVPHRLEDGYGLNKETLQKLATEQGVNLIVTVDCGIASVDEAAEADRLGMELIITDHHEPKETLPAASALVHPRLPGTAYPFGGLSGAGVAFKLAWALCKKHSGSAKVTPVLREFLLDAIMLAALGTVADVVPLFEENRIFVRHGLARLRAKPILGLQLLLRCAKLEKKENVGAVDIGYALAPRINAAGRLGTARLAVELLTTSSEERAMVLADYLERQNKERQTMERRILHEAREQAARHLHAPALVLASADWHPGLLGIVASRLVDQYARPVLMIAVRDGQPHAQGSGRSVPGFMLHEALQACTSDLVGHGGHATAAGFRILPESIDIFRENFCAFVARQRGAEPQPLRLTLDAEVPLSALTTGMMQGIEQLEPYGAGNPPPLLLADRLQVVGAPKKVGEGERHLAFRVKQNGKEVRAIAFAMGERCDELMSQGGVCCLAFTPRWNEWNGYKSVEIEVKDFQAGPQAKLG
ncbi:MAG: single-stranded-DNA-specific exonuclease RecJ [Planctomycetes bacterium]|nr:single-stranded-DNA-specific exonuclease RecJ [Planctomycetota bacterium]